MILDLFKRGYLTATRQISKAVLALVGTDEKTAQEAIAKTNTTLAENLTAKGVEADATEATEKLAEKVKNVPSYDDGYNAGLKAGAGAADAILDGTAFASGEYTNNTVKSLRMGAFRNTYLKRLYCSELETIAGTLFSNNDEHTLEYVKCPKLKHLGTAALAFNSRLTGDWSFIEQLESLNQQSFRGCALPENVILKNFTTYETAWGSAFDEVYSLKFLCCPKLQKYVDRFITSTAISLQTVELGSVGYPVTSMHANTFSGNTSITSVTVYCEDPNNPPTGSPWGAPNATVTFLKA